MHVYICIYSEPKLLIYKYVDCSFMNSVLYNCAITGVHHRTYVFFIIFLAINSITKIKNDFYKS